MRSSAHRRATGQLFETLESRMLMSAALTATPLISPIFTSPRHYRAVEISGDMAAGHTAQDYFDVRKRMRGPTPVLTVHAAAGTWNSSLTSATLSAYATFAGTGGDAVLTYTWTPVVLPGGATPVLGANASFAARNTVVTFDRAGDYKFSVLISDGHNSVTDSVTFTLAATAAHIDISPGTPSLAAGDTLAFTAAVSDQFNQPTNTSAMWSLTGPGSIDPNGLFHAPDTAGSATVQAATGGITASLGVTITPPVAPTVVTPGGATLSPGGTQAALSVLAEDNGGEPTLTYTWSIVSQPAGGAAAFSTNGVNAAKNAVVTFHKAGSYTFMVTIANALATTTSSVNLTVAQALNSISVKPTTATVNLNQPDIFSASAFDQFGDALAIAPTFAWSLTSGTGSVDSTGVFSAASAGPVTVRATSAGINGSANITVINAAPTVASAASAGAGPFTGTTAALAALGADDGGAGALTYTWSTLTQPAGALAAFSVNNSNAARNTTVTFTRSGSYTFRATISDGALTVTSNVTVIVSATLTTITVAPGSPALQVGDTVTFTTSATDQFGQALASPGTITWSIDAGGVGSINSAGLYTAASAGSAVVRATIGSATGSTTVSITAANPPLTVTSQALTGFTDLVIWGTSVFDTITVSQAGTLFTITNHGIAQTISGTFQDLVIHAGSAGSLITINSSVTINVRAYGGAGTDDLRISGTGSYNAIVSIGGGNDSLTGNGVSTYFWADTADTVNATTADQTANRVHKLTGFYQPFSTDPTNAKYVSTTLSGQNIADPTDAGSTHHSSTWSLFGTAPLTTDIRQGGIGDCYVLAALGSLAFSGPARIYRSAVDLGDGTYAVRFYRNGVESIVRVDADLSSVESAVSSTGGIWVPIFEKAYAFYRSASNTYASLDSGWMFAVLTDLECTASNIFTFSSDSVLATAIQNGLTAGTALSVGTGTTIASGAPMITSHAYMVVGVYFDSTAATWKVQLRNPWGYDGTGNDGNTADGIVTLTFAQLRANCSVVVAGV